MGAAHDREYQAFLSHLKAARESAGMTQSEVAAALSRPQSFVSKCESGERRVDAVELVRLLKVYGVTLPRFVRTLPRWFSR